MDLIQKCAEAIIKTDGQTEKAGFTDIWIAMGFLTFCDECVHATENRRSKVLWRELRDTLSATLFSYTKHERDLPARINYAALCLKESQMYDISNKVMIDNLTIALKEACEFVLTDEPDSERYSYCIGKTIWDILETLNIEEQHELFSMHAPDLWKQLLRSISLCWKKKREQYAMEEIDLVDLTYSFLNSPGKSQITK